MFLGWGIMKKIHSPRKPKSRKVEKAKRFTAEVSDAERAGMCCAPLEPSSGHRQSISCADRPWYPRSKILAIVPGWHYSHLHVPLIVRLCLR